jgi:hypothetical protein
MQPRPMALLCHFAGCVRLSWYRQIGVARLSATDPAGCATDGAIGFDLSFCMPWVPSAPRMAELECALAMGLICRFAVLIPFLQS